MVKLTSAKEGLISMGPWGGLKGEPWAYKPDGPITEIIVHHGGAVDSISFRSESSESCDDDFTVPPSQKFGGPGVIGIDHKASSSINSVVQRDAGPWGDHQRGRPWDDGVFLAIKQVTLGIVSGYGCNVIQGIELKYEQRDGSSFTSLHGSFSDTLLCGFYSWGGATKKEVVTLDSASDEVIVGLEGFYGSAKYTNGFEVITSITIHTNKRKYGPIGVNEHGVHFSSMLSGGKVVGFFGRSGACLNAIGLHTMYC